MEDRIARPNASEQVRTQLHTLHEYYDATEAGHYNPGDIKAGKYAMVIDGQPQIVIIDAEGNCTGELSILDEPASVEAETAPDAEA